MKIFSINPTNIVNQTTKQLKNEPNQISDTKQLPTKEFPISFWGVVPQVQPNGLRRPQLTNEQLKKVFYLTKILPNGSNITQPRTININNKDFAYKVSKDFSGRAKVEIKDNVNSPADWLDEAKDKFRTILKCNFDPKGMLVGGTLSNGNNNGEIFNAEFKHTGKEGRRLIINDEIYRPINKDSSKWVLLPELQTRTKTNQICDLSTEYNGSPLMNSLIELATNRTSLQLLER